MQARPIDELRTRRAAPSTGRTEAEREAVLAEMASILSDPVFRRSHRCVALLGYMVQHALDGDLAGIKERTLGIEVFGRDNDYDSNADPIVRMTANEIRKRLAQYYQENGSQHGVRIRLVAGSYIPEFEFVPPDPVRDGETHEVEPTPRPVMHAPFQTQPFASIRKLSPRSRWILVTAVLIVLAAAVALTRSSLFRSSQYLAWKPLISSGNPLIVSVADNATLEMRGVEDLTDAEKRLKIQRIADMINSRQAPSISDPKHFDPTTPFVDANMAHLISSWLQTRGESSLLRASSALTLNDFRSRPVVLVGGFDNPWTVILLSDMRFSPRVDAVSGTFWIGDTQHPANRNWARKVLEESPPTVDYAVITRFFDTETGNWVLAIGGLGPHGTEAASQLLTDPVFSHSLPRQIRSGGNFQIVVATKVINGDTGPPQIVAVHSW